MNESDPTEPTLTDRSAILQRELGEIQDELDYWHREHVEGWQAVIAGKVRFTGRMNSQRIARTVGILYVLAVAGGVVLCLTGGEAAQSIGSAMIVGGFFGFATFGTEAWSKQMDREYASSPEAVRVSRLLVRQEAILVELQVLEQNRAPGSTVERGQ